MKNRNIVILAGGISSRMRKPVEQNKLLDNKLALEADSKSKSMISVGVDGRPFLDYLLYNVSEAGYINVLIVIGEKDESIKNYYSGERVFSKLNIAFATQLIPEGRGKPFGTADALFQGLNSVKGWKDESFTVVNSDNLYSQKALQILLESEYDNAMIDYDSKGFELGEERVKAYAISLKNKNGFLIDIVEKPNEEQMKQAYDSEGILRVSMNIFKLKYNVIYNFLKTCPINPVRNEKELPTAVKMMIKENPESLYCYPISEHVPDLTNKEDIIPTKNYLEKQFGGIIIN
ncbi:MAG: nucleotidyltransferase [Bacteroidetes bacterium]|nr:nucleotidyltransferase [Bacteroidota bacterium]